MIVVSVVIEARRLFILEAHKQKLIIIKIKEEKLIIVIVLLPIACVQKILRQGDYIIYSLSNFFGKKLSKTIQIDVYKIPCQDIFNY